MKRQNLTITQGDGNLRQDIEDPFILLIIIIMNYIRIFLILHLKPQLIYTSRCLQSHHEGSFS